ncbi:MAG: hypothetical protein EOO67_17220, partial [Microbacterium sp.]
MRHLSKALPAVLASLALALSSIPVQAAPAATAPGLRFFSPNLHPVMTVHTSGEDRWIDFNPAMYLGSRRTKFEIDVRRRDAQHRIRAVVHVDGRTRDLPAGLLDGWRGFKDAFTLRWSTP